MGDENLMTLFVIYYVLLLESFSGSQKERRGGGNGNHERNQASVPPRLQDAANRPKRYSSQRQVQQVQRSEPEAFEPVEEQEFYDQGRQIHDVIEWRTFFVSNFVICGT